MTEKSKAFDESEDKKKNTPISVYIPNDAKEKITGLLDEMGFDNMHQYLQYSALYLLSEYIKNPKVIKTTAKPAKPKF